MSDLNALIEANRELIERSLDLSIGSHLRLEAQIMLTIAPEDRNRIGCAATGMTNRCGGRYSDGLWRVASDYSADPLKWREERIAEEEERLAAREQKRADEIELAATLHRQRKAREAKAQQSA